MKNRARVNVFICITAVLFIIVLVISNVGVAAVKMATVPGSYGEDYAKKHLLKTVSISDSDKGYFDQRYETFDYNYEDGGIVIEKYSGNSESLTIPMQIGGDYVIGIGEAFFDNLSASVKNVYLPETIIHVDAKPTDKVNIYCTDSSVFKALEGDKEWKIETRYDSEFVNFLLGDLEFSYNTTGNEIDITGYIGNDKDLVVIPSYINGVPVRKVTMNMLGTAGAFVIPETVTSITGRTTKAVFGLQFAIQLAFTVLAFLLALIVVNVVLPRFKKDNSEFLLSAPQVIVAILYVVLQAAFCIVTVYFIHVPLLVSIAVSCVLLVVFITMSFLGGAQREHSKAISEKIEEDTSFMRNLKESTKYLADGIEDEEAKKAVEKLVEEIKFSKLKGRDVDLDNKLEFGVSEMRKLVDEKNHQGIVEKASELISLLKKR